MKQISLIGLSRAGKTCYTYAMANAMGHHQHGISISANDFDVQDELFEGWDKIREDGIWPASTDLTSKFIFECALYNRPVFEFWWRDYRGGSLSGRDDISKEERRDFTDYIKESDGIIFFIASDMLLGIKEKRDNWRNDFRHLETFVRYVTLQKEKIRTIPFVIAITKADLLSETDKTAMAEFARNLLAPLFTSGYGAKTLLTFVSLGKNLKCGDYETSVGGCVFYDPTEGNIHLPVMFNLYHYLLYQAEDARAELDKMENELSDTRLAIRRYNEHCGLWRFFNSDAELINNKDGLEKAIEEMKEKIEQVETDLEMVRKEFIQDCYYYVDGELQKKQEEELQEI